jgi:hypothetical protein
MEPSELLYLAELFLVALLLGFLVEDRAKDWHALRLPHGVTCSLSRIVSKPPDLARRADEAATNNPALSNLLIRGAAP